MALKLPSYPKLKEYWEYLQQEGVFPVTEEPGKCSSLLGIHIGYPCVLCGWERRFGRYIRRGSNLWHSKKGGWIISWETEVLFQLHYWEADYCPSESEVRGGAGYAPVVARTPFVPSPAPSRPAPPASRRPVQLSLPFPPQPSQTP